MSISLASPIRLLTAWCEQLALYDSLSIQAADSFVHFFGDWIRDSTRCLSVW